MTNINHSSAGGQTRVLQAETGPPLPFMLTSSEILKGMIDCFKMKVDAASQHQCSISQFCSSSKVNIFSIKLKDPNFRKLILQQNVLIINSQLYDIKL